MQKVKGAQKGVKDGYDVLFFTHWIIVGKNSLEVSLYKLSYQENNVQFANVVGGVVWEMDTVQLYNKAIFVNLVEHAYDLNFSNQLLQLGHRVKGELDHLNGNSMPCIVVDSPYHFPEGTFPDELLYGVGWWNELPGVRECYLLHRLQM